MAMPKPDFALDRRRRAGERPGSAIDTPDTLLREVSELVQTASATIRDLLAACRPDEPLIGGLESIYATTQELESVCGRLTAHGSRTDPAVLAPADINALTAGMSPMLERLAGPFIALDLALHPGAAWVVATRGQLEQLIVNLVMHARDALPLGGTVRVATRRLVLHAPQTFFRGVLAAGDWTLIEVRDSGPGADHGDRSHLVESAFDGPDRAPGNGTDLGAARRMAERVGGCLVVDVAPRTGTAITICLPSARPRRERRALRGSPQAILVVDGDEWTRTSAAHLLRRAGYGVLMAAHATEALELLHDVAGRCVRLVLADVALAGPGPHSLVAALRRERPGLPVIVMASPAVASVAQSSLDTEAAVVMKPLRSSQLLQAIRLRFGIDGGAGHLAPAHAALLNSPR
ncbi:MAG TPA: ATP-binding protein [Gemmatimonadales bacterium]|jgi:CheY-like chemotaxis protein|nr:ATP-binding protein [Gemmatimonadales bacterium]